MLQKVRSTDSDAKRGSTAQEVKPGSGSGAWEALLKKTTSASSGEGPSPFAKTQADPSPSSFAPPVEADEKITPDPSKSSKRTISLDFGAGGNPFQKPD
jgi:hypothetical protein